jgi:hypothetical protein
VPAQQLWGLKFKLQYHQKRNKKKWESILIYIKINIQNKALIYIYICAFIYICVHIFFTYMCINACKRYANSNCPPGKRRRNEVFVNFIITLIN